MFQTFTKSRISKPDFLFHATEALANTLTRTQGLALKTTKKTIYLTILYSMNPGIPVGDPQNRSRQGVLVYKESRIEKIFLKIL